MREHGAKSLLSTASSTFASEPCQYHVPTPAAFAYALGPQCDACVPSYWACPHVRKPHVDNCTACAQDQHAQHSRSRTHHACHILQGQSRASQMCNSAKHARSRTHHACHILQGQSRASQMCNSTLSCRAQTHTARSPSAGDLTQGQLGKQHISQVACTHVQDTRKAEGRHLQAVQVLIKASPGSADIAYLLCNGAVP